MTIAELYTAIGGNYEAVKRILPMDPLIQKFIIKLLDDKSFDRLMAAKEALDPKELFEASHALKGICANLGLDELSRLASVVAEEFRPGKSRTMDDNALKAHLEVLQNKYETSIAVIKQFAADCA